MADESVVWKVIADVAGYDECLMQTLLASVSLEVVSFRAGLDEIYDGDAGIADERFARSAHQRRLRQAAIYPSS